MLVPRAPAFGVKLELPRGTGSVLLAIASVLAAAIAVAIVSSARIHPDQAVAPVQGIDTTARSVAYIVPVRIGGVVQDVVYVYGSEAASPREIARFPVLDFPATHARGSASFLGDSLAILWTANALDRNASLSLLDVASSTVDMLDVKVDLHSELVWGQFPTGARLAVASTAPRPEAPFSDVTIYEVDIATARATPRVTIEKVRSAAPVGYSADGRSLYFVTIDQRGSILWKDTAGEQVELAVLSPGRTTGWRLDPTGSQLAFVDLLGAGARSAAGRTLILATGVIVSTDTAGDPLTAAWRPGNPAPDFGGIGGGTLSIDGAEGVNLMPVAWSADGSRLAAVTVTDGDPGQSLELLLTTSTGNWRVLLSREPHAALLGFVVDAEGAR